MTIQHGPQQQVVEHYQRLFEQYGDAPEAVQYTDASGQRFRFEQLVKIAPLQGRRILDLGCGLGHLYPFVLQRVGPVDYTGVDLVQAMVRHASEKYPSGRFLCRDLLRDPLAERFDYVFVCGVFNNAMPRATELLKRLVAVAFAHCDRGVAFNFISTYVNHRDAHMAYHDPSAVLTFCLQRLSPRVTMFHHYERCDVAVFVYR